MNINKLQKTEKMKKVMILTAAVMALGFATPQAASAMKTPNTIEVTQAKEVKYTEIKTEEIPAAVSKSISTAYQGYKVDKAYLGNDGNYKIKVSSGELKHVLFFTAKGELIKAEEPAKKTELPPKM